MQVSPLGIIELSDEEFEVHGPRMVRYANAAAFYLGHHWAYRKQAGEPQLCFNFVQAMSDYLVNFTFSKGVNFKVDRAYQHIVPALLDRIWTIDNRKERLLWEIGQMGGIFGDAFVKVAYEEPYADGAGIVHPGRVVIVPMNPAHCFPTWHPHDRSRLTQFKQKYKFWSTEPDGTRTVRTYTEIITDTQIKEYRDNELIRDTPNPLGVIPVVHIANQIAPGSPWGLSDVWNIIPLNREYNEKATEISSILNYYVAPVTVVTGDKPRNAIRGPNKVWGFGNEHAKVFNLDGGSAGLPQALEYMNGLKERMHEFTGVPENALGQEQAISNTSGVALAIQYMPTMQKYGMKKITYGEGIQRICQLALMTLFLKDPNAIYYDPNTDGIMEDGQAPFVDPADFRVYDIDLDWPQPLPVDIIVKLDELLKKLQLGILSKRAAFQALGEEFPDEKLRELFEEKLTDLKQDGSMRVLTSSIDALIMELTGMVPEGAEPVPPPPAPAGNGNGQSMSAPAPPKPDPAIMNAAAEITKGMGPSRNLLADIVTQAYSPRVPMERQIDKNDAGD
jgi:hypothetical protein